MNSVLRKFHARLVLMEPLFQQLGIALLLGLLVGLQREHAASGMAGMRTFPLITVLGSVSAVLADHFQESWPLVAGLLAIVAVMIVGHLFRPQEKGTGPICPDQPSVGARPPGASHKSDQSPFASAHPGTTTDVAMLLMYVVGALVVIGPMPVAIAIGGGVAVLLQFKPELHSIAQRLGDEDLRAIMQFVLITCIILPVLPNQDYSPLGLLQLHAAAPGQPRGPLEVLNPFETWLMVALIVGLSLGGYIVYKFWGRDAGILLGGVLGGAISSTATTVSYARSARGDSPAAHIAAIVVMIASTVMYVRVLLAVAVVSPEFLMRAAVPIAILMLLTLVPAMVLWFRVRGQPTQMPQQTNPTQLKSALVFGAMYAAVLLALAAAQQYWHGRGLYAVAFFSGLTEMDAVTLSTARLSLTDPMVAADGWRMLVVAAMANLVSKAGIAGLLGGWRFFCRITLLFAVPMLGGAALLAWL
jgi:uncharacterized membrane protein (DUF4010 family)